MNLLKVSLNLFAIALVFVAYFIATLNLNGFMYSTLLCIAFGIWAFILNVFYGKELSK